MTVWVASVPLCRCACVCVCQTGVVDGAKKQTNKPNRKSTDPSNSIVLARPPGVCHDTRQELLLVQAEHVPTAKHFVILHRFGPGTPGKVRLIGSTAGMPVATKVYRFPPLRLVTGNDQEAENQKPKRSGDQGSGQGMGLVEYRLSRSRRSKNSTGHRSSPWRANLSGFARKGLPTQKRTLVGTMCSRI